MAKEIRITTTKLSDDAGQIADILTDLKTASKQIAESVRRLNDMWDGKAKQAFVDIVEEDLATLDEIINEISGLQKYDAHATKQYEACEHEIENLISLIRV